MTKDLRDEDPRKDATIVGIRYEYEPTDEKLDITEAQRFRDFLPTKNGCMVFGLTGHDNIGDEDGDDEVTG